MKEVLGRTNRVFPSTWFGLQLPIDPHPEALRDLAAAASKAGPVDVSGSPALWGQALRGLDATTITFGGLELENARDRGHVVDLIQAHILQTLSGLGRPKLDIYFLQIRRALEEHQILGALEGLEGAREDGLIGHIGLSAEGSGLATLSVWQFHDGFEVLVVPRNAARIEPFETLNPLAKDRRVGVVTSRTLNWGAGCSVTCLPSLASQENAAARLASCGREFGPVLVGVRSPEEVAAHLESAAPGLEQEAMKAWNDIKEWLVLQDDPRPWVKRAAERRIQDLV